MGKANGIRRGFKITFKEISQFSHFHFQFLSDLFFVAQIITVARTHAELSTEPVYLLKWSIDDELNLMKRNSYLANFPGKYSKLRTFRNFTVQYGD